MRRLNKGKPLSEFVTYRVRHAPKNWDEFGDGCGTLKQQMTQVMLTDEQDSLCGYTELPIGSRDTCHIDHYKKRSQFPSLIFEWDNFVVATMDDDFGARYKDLVYRIQIHEYSQIINPVLTNAQDYFYYPDYDLGNILPKLGLDATKKAMAEKTIEVFNLRHPALKRKRGQVIQLISDYGDLPSADIRACLVDYGFKSLVEQYTQSR